MSRLDDKKRFVRWLMNSSWSSYDEERWRRLSDNEVDTRDCDNKQYGRLDLVPPERVDTLYDLSQAIATRNLLLMDKDDMGTWRASGFYLTPDLKIVLYHER